MSINLEQIDELRKRANVSYEDAKNALEECSGNIIEALVLLEKQNKIKPHESPSSEGKFFKMIKRLIKKGNETKVIVKKDEIVVLNLCVTIAVIVSVVATPLVIVALVIALATNHKIKIQKKNHKDLEEVNNIFDKMSVAVNKVTTKITEEMKTE